MARTSGSPEGRNQLFHADAEVAKLHKALADAARIDTQGSAARDALLRFEPVWAELNPKERAQLLRLLVERIRVDGQAGKVSFVFRADGIAALAQRAGAA